MFVFSISIIFNNYSLTLFDNVLKRVRTSLAGRPGNCYTSINTRMILTCAIAAQLFPHCLCNSKIMASSSGVQFLCYHFLLFINIPFLTMRTNIMSISFFTFLSMTTRNTLRYFFPIILTKSFYCL